MPCRPLMMCSRSLNGSSALIGSGSLAFASEPLLFIPSGMQVFGSKPWFCMKKTIRFGVALLVSDATSRSGTSERPNAAPAPAAIPCSIFLRLSMIDLSTRLTVNRLYLCPTRLVEVPTAIASRCNALPCNTLRAGGSQWRVAGSRFMRNCGAGLQYRWLKRCFYLSVQRFFDYNIRANRRN